MLKYKCYDVPAKHPLMEPEEEEAVAEEEKIPAGGGAPVAVKAEVGAVPTTAVAVVSTLAVVMQEGHTEGALLPEGGLRVGERVREGVSIVGGLCIVLLGCIERVC